MFCWAPLQPSKCNSECATIGRACSKLSDSLDLSDLSEALYNGKSRSALTQMACYDMTTTCKAKPPPVPKVRSGMRMYGLVAEQGCYHSQ